MLAGTVLKPTLHPAPGPTGVEKRTFGKVFRSWLLQGIMTPVEQRATPVAFPHVALRLLGLVAVDVADDPPHVVDLVARVVGSVLPEDLDNLSARLVAL
jgi:hypothetical protein